MNTTTTASSSRPGIVFLLGLANALLVAAVLTDTAAQFGLDDRAAFFLLVIGGLAMCGAGKLGEGARYGWWNPLHLAGYAIGTLALLLAGAILFGLPLPLIATARQAVIALALLMSLKVGIAALYPRQA